MPTAEARRMFLGSLGNVAQTIRGVGQEMRAYEAQEEQRKYEEEQRQKAWDRQDAMIAGERARIEQAEAEQLEQQQASFMGLYGAGQPTGQIQPMDPELQGLGYSPQPDFAGGETAYQPEMGPAGPMRGMVGEDMYALIDAVGMMTPEEAQWVLPDVKAQLAQSMQVYSEQQRGAELFANLSGLISPQFAPYIQSMEDLVMFKGLTGQSPFDPAAFETADGILAQELARTKNVFEYAGFSGYAMGKSAEDIAGTLTDMGFEGVGTDWVQKSIDMYTQMHTPRPVGGVGAAEEERPMPSYGDLNYFWAGLTPAKQAEWTQRGQGDIDRAMLLAYWDAYPRDGVPTGGPTGPAVTYGQVDPMTGEWEPSVEAVGAGSLAAGITPAEIDEYYFRPWAQALENAAEPTAGAGLERFGEEWNIESVWRDIYTQINASPLSDEQKLELNDRLYKIYLQNR